MAIPDTIGDDCVVSIQYTLKNDDGELLDSSGESGPLSYLHGHGNLIPALEEALAGQNAGFELSISFTPEQGYGEYDPKLVFSVPREQMGIDPEEGQVVQAVGEGGAIGFLRVIGVTDSSITLDGNHPMAGVNLNFEVKVIEIREATAEELEQKHIHGAGCNH